MKEASPAIQNKLLATTPACVNEVTHGGGGLAAGGTRLTVKTLELSALAPAPGRGGPGN